jgi:diguanylate cyclase (GGDEF)-like protein
MALIGPGILCVFGLAFLWAWIIEKKRHYLLLLAAAPMLFALGVIVQAFSWPAGVGPNALLSGLFYTTAVLLTAEGIVRRSGKRFGLALDLAFLAAIMGGLWYFLYVSPNLLVRVYIQNFGYGLILLVAALYLKDLMRGRRVDRVLFWVLLAFGIHFFVRTILTIGLTAPVGAKAFGASLFWHALHLSVAVLGAALALTVLAASLSDVIDDLRREGEIDGLTGVLNRRAFESRASSLIAAAGHTPCSLVACDLDRFKEINDRYGHAAGDKVLRAFGEFLRAAVRASDLAGRIGGEEFAILMPGSTRDEAFQLAERLRVEWSEFEFSHPGGERVTASFGVAVVRAGDNLIQLLERADTRLYQAKATGRNRTVAEDITLATKPA